jgi:hypothetical protein
MLTTRRSPDDGSPMTDRPTTVRQMAVRRLTGLDEPQETRVFLLMSAFGIGVGVVYWFLAYEVAGTILLLAFGAATGLIGVRLVADPTAATVRRNARERSAPTTDAPGGGTGNVDRPFADESGRLPSATIAPFVLGLGIATAATAVVFGPAPLIVGALPIAWGAWSWLTSARAELDATEAERPGAPLDGRRVAGAQSSVDGDQPDVAPRRRTRRRNEHATKSGP